MAKDTKNIQAPEPGIGKPPADMEGAGPTRVIINEFKDDIREIRTDIKDIKDHRHPDFVLTMKIFGGGFLILAGMLIAGYFILDHKIEHLSDKIDKSAEITSEKIDKLSSTVIRADTKLEDLLNRIPPIQSPAPRR